mgnify:CR=1 FL=1
MSNTLKIPNVKSDAIITIEVSGHFLKQLQMLLIALGEQKPPEEFNRVLEKLKANEPADHERMKKLGYLHKDEMQGGGEIEVDNDTLAALIAAGADIEIL